MTTQEPILPGAEPFFFEGNDIGVLVSHGFTGTPQSMRFVGEALHRRGGYTVLGPLLPGHGTSPEAMARSTAHQWVGAIDEALATLRRRCRRIFMTGLSMGGSLSLLMAARHADIAGIVPVNACVQLGSADLAALVFDPAAPPFIPGIGSDIQQPGVTELAYDRTPVAALGQGLMLFTVARDLLPRVRCPVLVLQSDEDHVVPPVNGELILAGLGSTDKTLERLHRSYHVATLDHDKELIVERTHAFIERLR